MKKTRDETPLLQEVGETEARWRGLAARLVELGEDAMDAQLLVAFRAAREEGVVPPDAGFFLVAHILTSMADEAIGEAPSVCRLALELELMEREYGVEQGAWLSGEEAPPRTGRRSTRRMKPPVTRPAPPSSVPTAKRRWPGSTWRTASPSTAASRAGAASSTACPCCPSIFTDSQLLNFSQSNDVSREPRIVGGMLRLQSVD
ncbi:hypothetical protein [Myxococcus hansupus]|uniref:hypothetical protein n=1 Tax=Pseudomyxococcus hansupus TaxID=1297742 RepID=UPI000B19EDDD|nr:hypothetical protein [Myxococcus hansupus]